MATLSPQFGSIVPSPIQLPNPNNYLAFDAGANDFAQQYLPEIYEQEVERYGNRTLSGFLRMVGAEMPMTSDQVIWSEQNRLHISYDNCGIAADQGGGAANSSIVKLGGGATAINVISVNDTIVMLDPVSGAEAKGIVIATVAGAGGVGGAGGAQITVRSFANATFAAQGMTISVANALGSIKVFVYGSDYTKGTTTTGALGAGVGNSAARISATPAFTQFSNSPVIIRDQYVVSGSDMAQIGWVEVTTENGATGYLWYLKSEHETRLRFDDYLETSMLEAVPAVTNSGAATELGNAAVANTGAGSEGVFYVVNNRGNVWSGGNPNVLGDFDSIIQRLDKQGSIEENVIFVDRQFGFDIDDMLAAQNSYGAGGTSYGLFDNDQEMALNLGFTGFRRGYDFYKSDWKYLNDPTMRGGLPQGSGSGRINGLLVPAGSTSVYDQILGKNAKRPFLHVRYRASETEDRRYKTWITGSAGGAQTSSLDAMEVNFLSERAVCTLGANNFFLFQE